MEFQVLVLSRKPARLQYEEDSAIHRASIFNAFNVSGVIVPVTLRP
jgi:hypothetical protein